MERFVDAVDRVAAGTPGTVMYPSPYQSPLADTWPGGINPAAPGPAATPRRFELPFAIVGVVVLLLAAGWIGLSLFSQKGKPPDAVTQAPPAAVPGVTVPDFVGTDSTDVAKTADLIGLSVQMSDGRTQAPFLEGVVTSQTPAAGSTVSRSTHIELRVATRTVPTPTLVGTTLNSALAALERSGLQLGKTETQFVADAKPGMIVRQRPEAGAAAAAGSVVDVVVAATAAPAPRKRSLTNEPQGTVPDLRGLTEADAVLAVRRAGLRVGLVSTRSGSAPTAGKVVDQSPARGAPVRLGTAVHLTVSAAASESPKR
jgi:beta-lactam-binding protein with PASTA domain